MDLTELFLQSLLISWMTIFQNCALLGIYIFVSEKIYGYRPPLWRSAPDMYKTIRGPIIVPDMELDNATESTSDDVKEPTTDTTEVSTVNE